MSYEDIAKELVNGWFDIDAHTKMMRCSGRDLSKELVPHLELKIVSALKLAENTGRLKGIEDAEKAVKEHVCGWSCCDEDWKGEFVHISCIDEILKELLPLKDKK